MDMCRSINPLSATRCNSCHHKKVKVKGWGRNISYLAGFFTYFHGYFFFYQEQLKEK